MGRKAPTHLAMCLDTQPFTVWSGQWLRVSRAHPSTGPSVDFATHKCHAPGPSSEVFLDGELGPQDTEFLADAKKEEEKVSEPQNFPSSIFLGRLQGNAAPGMGALSRAQSLGLRRPRLQGPGESPRKQDSVDTERKLALLSLL